MFGFGSVRVRIEHRRRQLDPPVVRVRVTLRDRERVPPREVPQLWPENGQKVV